MVLEMVFPGKPGSANYKRNYEEKPAEYTARGIPEYWRIDPNRSVVAVLWLVGGEYQVSEFCDNAGISSPTFPDLRLTAEQILNAGQSN